MPGHVQVRNSHIFVFPFDQVGRRIAVNVVEVRSIGLVLANEIVGTRHLLPCSLVDKELIYLIPETTGSPVRTSINPAP